MTKLISFATICILTIPTVGFAGECFYNTSDVNSGQRTAYPANWDGTSAPTTYTACSTQATSYVTYDTPAPVTSTVAQSQNTSVQATQQPVKQTPAPQNRQISVGGAIAANVAADVITYSILRAIFN